MDQPPPISSAPKNETKLATPIITTGPLQARKEPSTSSLASAASSSGIISTSPPQRTPSQSSLHKVHRQSFAENLRNAPPSPRAQRHPSFTGVQPSVIADLLSLPPTHKMADPRFAGRDWREVTVGELVAPEDVNWVDMNTSVEETTMMLVKNSPTNVVLIRESEASEKVVSTFDYTDLNAYLLVVVGLAHPSEETRAHYEEIATKAREGSSIPLKDIQMFCRNESLVMLPAGEHLTKAIEVFGSGIHRLLVTNEAGHVVGILSQLRLIEFFWAEGANYPSIEKLYPVQIRDLGIGSQHILAVNSDSALADALMLMNNEGLTSVAVIDNGNNVVGNISTVDVKHLTSAANAPLLQSSCMHFISVILNERGIEKGRDTFPVFHVTPHQTLAHTVAKLVATQSHRMWVVESASPSPSTPATPALASTVLVPGPGSAPQSPAPGATFGSVPASAMPGAHLSGRLSGVISLTDILNMFAKQSGLHPSDPGEQRARRRRSSSSSVRPSIDSSRASADIRR